ncbi:hypothetical protein ACH5RR_020824 [Cinchona calisaya]|uniref:Yippee domain-containing protein n=1 Tax=Cinchona calisaya TaxID=153742 RepID=A0ABD2ZJ22_9GENT
MCSINVIQPDTFRLLNLHTVQDVHCASCNQLLGWRYIQLSGAPCGTEAVYLGQVELQMSKLDEYRMEQINGKTQGVLVPSQDSTPPPPPLPLHDDHPEADDYHDYDPDNYIVEEPPKEQEKSNQVIQQDGSERGFSTTPTEQKK